MVLSLIFILAQIVYPRGRDATGTFWIGDNANDALRVNCVAGCGASGGSGLTDAELRATPVPVSLSQAIALSQTGTDNNVDCNITNGSIAVTGTFWQGTQPVSISQTGTNNDVDATVSGSVSVSNFPAGFNVNNFPTTATTSSVSVRCVNAAGNAFESCAGGGGTASTVAISQTGTENDVDATVSGSVSVSNFPATQPVSIASAIDVNTTTADAVTASINQTGTANDVDANITNASIPVTGTFWPATQPVSGTVAVSNFPATQPVSGTVSISGTVTTSGGGLPGTPFNCAITSTAVASTSITNCGPPGASLTRYITTFSWFSSIISTTTNFFTLQYGTGSNCGTGTVVIYRGFSAPAFTGNIVNLNTPIVLGTNTDLCFLHPGAGTRVVNVTGYIAAP